VTLNFGLALVAAYLIGSIPTGLWLGQVSRGIDIRQHGSGNLGATNVVRVLGPGYGALTFIIDALKGWIPVIVCRGLMQTPVFATMTNCISSTTNPAPCGIALTPFDLYYAPALIGMATILGHIFSVFVEFRGGKGVATSAGVFAALMPRVFIAAFAVFLLMLACTRYVSLSSIIAAVTLAVAAYFMAPNPFLRVMTALVSLMVIWLHRANIRRLLNGTEPRLGASKAGAPA
jgi:acyl phosphate:glycerol-3-phosphate acyltransferase